MYVVDILLPGAFHRFSRELWRIHEKNRKLPMKDSNWAQIKSMDPQPVGAEGRERKALLFVFRSHPVSTWGFLLALHSRITPSGYLETSWGARNQT